LGNRTVLKKRIGSAIPALSFSSTKEVECVGCAYIWTNVLHAVNRKKSARRSRTGNEQHGRSRRLVSLQSYWFLLVLLGPCVGEFPLITQRSLVQNPAPATMNDEGLADAGAANPFRLPRLHPGIGRAHGAEHHSFTGVRMGAPLAFSSITTKPGRLRVAGVAPHDVNISRTFVEGLPCLEA